MTDTKTARSFMILANDHVEEVLDDGDSTAFWSGNGIYRKLVDAGYPTNFDVDSPFHRCVDLRVDADGIVTAYAGREEWVPDVAQAEVFLRWYRANAEEEN